MAHAAPLDPADLLTPPPARPAGGGHRALPPRPARARRRGGARTLPPAGRARRGAGGPGASERIAQALAGAEWWTKPTETNANVDLDLDEPPDRPARRAAAGGQTRRLRAAGPRPAAPRPGAGPARPVPCRPGGAERLRPRRAGGRHRPIPARARPGLASGPCRPRRLPRRPGAPRRAAARRRGCGARGGRRPWPWRQPRRRRGWPRSCAHERLAPWPSPPATGRRRARRATGSPPATATRPRRTPTWWWRWVATASCWRCCIATSRAVRRSTA